MSSKEQPQQPSQKQKQQQTRGSSNSSNSSNSSRPAMVSRSYSSDDASSKSAGLFVDRSGSKPLPLSGNRFVVPSLPFMKKSNNVMTTTNTATILRRTGDATAFSDRGRELSGDEDNVADAWICTHCNSKNHTRSKITCTLCGKSNTHKPTTTPRRGRRPAQRSSPPPPQPQQQKATTTPTTTRLEHSRSMSPPTTSPPSHHEQQPQQQHRQPSPPCNTPTPTTIATTPATRSLPGGGIIPVNPFDVHQNMVATSPTPAYTSSRADSTVVVVTRTPPDHHHHHHPAALLNRSLSVDTADSSSIENSNNSSNNNNNMVAGTATTMKNSSASVDSQEEPPQRQQQQQQHQHRSASPAFSTSTNSVDTPVRSNLAAANRDAFAAPYNYYPEKTKAGFTHAVPAAAAAADHSSGKFQILTRRKFGADWEGGTLV